MTDDTPRAADSCAQCGTPLEVAEAAEAGEDPHATELVLRCANGHEVRVIRHEESDAAR